MLVFTRRPNEAIMIGDGVEVRVLQVGRAGVRLGVVAPAEVVVHRREVYEQIRDENRSAAVAVEATSRIVERLRQVAARQLARPLRKPA